MQEQQLLCTMHSFSWAELLKLDKGDTLLHHSGYFATVRRVAPCRYEDGELELRFDHGPLKLLQLNYRAQLEHHVFYGWRQGWPAPKFGAGDRVWRRGGAIQTYRIVEGISPNCLGGYSYYLKGDRILHPESFLVRNSLAT